MNGQINAARDVTKTNTSQVETFRGLEFGELGVVDAETIRFYRAPLRRQNIPIGPRTQLPRVEIVMSYAGADGLLVRSLIAAGTVKGLVIAGLGLGSVPGSMFDAVQEARNAGIAVVISTRVPTGRVFPLSATKGSALALKRIGCVLADNLSPQKGAVIAYACSFSREWTTPNWSTTSLNNAAIILACRIYDGPAVADASREGLVIEGTPRSERRHLSSLILRFRSES